MKLGKFELLPAADGPFKLDGGMMFGIVPKPLWSKLVQPDDLNRVLLHTNCMLVRMPGRNVLVECGMGRKHSEKLRGIYGLQDEVQLVASLAKAGLKPEDISAVICTHLHLDHVGAGTRFPHGGCPAGMAPADCAVPTFPNAVYYAQRGEWEAATHPNPITKATYLPENLIPLQRAGRLELLDGDCEPVSGIRVHVTGGHTDHHQAIFAESEGQCMAFLGDIFPLNCSLRPAYNTAIDLHPLATMQEKMRLFDEAIRNNWLLWLYHDPQFTVIRLKRGKDYPEVAEVVMPAGWDDAMMG